jgi:S1-C subfamily serine protease
MEANSTPENRANPPSQTSGASQNSGASQTGVPSQTAGVSPAGQNAEEALNPRYIAILAIIAGLILLIGTLLKPATEIQQPQQQPVSQTEMVRLRRTAQKTTLENMSRYFSEVAGEFSAQVVRLPRLEASGLVWDDYGGIVAAASGGWAPSQMDLVGPAGSVIPVVTRIGGPHMPVVFLQAPVNTAFPQGNFRSAENLRAGEWVLAIARQPNGSFIFTPGWYTGRVATPCGEISFQRVSSDQSYSANMLGGGLFDMEGALLALIVQCNGSYVAMSVDDITTALGAENSLASQLLYRYGIKTEPLADDALRTSLQAEQGLLVSEVWKGYPAHSAGLLAGDLLVSLDGFPLTILQDLERLTRPGPSTIFDLQVRRGRETVSFLLQGNENRHAVSDGAATAAGIFLDDTEPGYRIGSVAPESPAALAGIRPGDRLLSIGNTAVTGPAVLRRLLTAPNRQPVLAVADRGEKLVALLIR